MILTIVIIRVRPDVIHPVVAGPTTTSPDTLGEFDLTSRIRTTLFFSIFSYIVITIALLWHRIRLENRSEQVQIRKLEVLGTYRSRSCPIHRKPSMTCCWDTQVGLAIFFLMVASLWWRYRNLTADEQALEKLESEVQQESQPMRKADVPEPATASD